MRQKTYDIKEDGSPTVSAELARDCLVDAAARIPSAKTGESVPYVMNAAGNRALTDYYLDTLVEWLGGIEVVARLAKEKQNYVMRDFATIRGSRI